MGAGRTPVREDALADVGLAWPVMRRMLLELGRRLVGRRRREARRRVLAAPGRARDAAASLDAGETRLASLAEAVEERKMLWRGQRGSRPRSYSRKAPGSWSSKD